MDEQEINDVQEKLRDERKPPKLKRFYKKATVSGKTAPFAIKLDKHVLKTPLKAALDLPTRKLARKIADEWNAQGEFVEPAEMFVTKYANTAIDRVETRRQNIVDEVVAFASSDLVCYRAESPQGLVDRQAQSWDAVLKWANDAHGLTFVCVAGIIYATQPDATLGALHKMLAEEKTANELTAIHNLTTLLGSGLLAIAACEGAFSDDEVWNAAHLDEDWNLELWGGDDDAAARRLKRRKEFDGILEFHRLAKV